MKCKFLVSYLIYLKKQFKNYNQFKVGLKKN